MAVGRGRGTNGAEEGPDAQTWSCSSSWVRRRLFSLLRSAHCLFRSLSSDSSRCCSLGLRWAHIPDFYANGGGRHLRANPERGALSGLIQREGQRAWPRALGAGGAGGDLKGKDLRGGPRGG